MEENFTPTLPVCTKEAAYHLHPDNVLVRQYRKVFQAEDVTAYIVDELSKTVAPVSLVYRTMLHKYNNGTSPCI
eukprot:687484-Ditylum_brightwellii.AAC.1